MSDVIQILDAIQQGDPKAADELLPLVNQELRRLAAFNCGGERPAGRRAVASRPAEQGHAKTGGLRNFPRAG